MISEVVFKDMTDLSGNVLKPFTGEAVRVSAREFDLTENTS